MPERWVGVMYTRGDGKKQNNVHMKLEDGSETWGCEVVADESERLRELANDPWHRFVGCVKHSRLERIDQEATLRPR